jgi:hypothetical protein
MATFADYSASPYDVRMTQGDTFSEAMLMEDGDGDAIDLAGYSFLSQLRRTADGAIVANFAISTDFGTSTVTRTLNSAITSTLDGTYVHDFQWTSPSGQVRTLFSGEFEIEPEVTR